MPPNERGLEVEKRAIFHSSLQLRAECMRGRCLNKYSIVHSDAEEEEEEAAEQAIEVRTHASAVA